MNITFIGLTNPGVNRIRKNKLYNVDYQIKVKKKEKGTLATHRVVLLCICLIVMLFVGSPLLSNLTWPVTPKNDTALVHVVIVSAISTSLYSNSSRFLL